MSRLNNIGIGEFLTFPKTTFEERRRMSVALTRLNKRYRNEKVPSTMVLDTKNGRTIVVRYAGVLEKVGGKFLIPRNPIRDL